MSDCVCRAWVENLPKINGPIVLQQIRSGGAFKFDAEPFRFCPWCGANLAELESSLRKQRGQSPELGR
ncbi:MAG TPA: hypothetical protein VGU20_30955 [Stellaceae bacterium]|nr:hypothetical protein [Terriglobia bacterium]HEV2551770.1 hypothetical protein [Stellaceae bacterium]